MKDATTLMSEENNPTVCLIAPLNAQLIQNMADSIGESQMIREIEEDIKGDLNKSYTSEEEEKQPPLLTPVSRDCLSS